VVEGHGPRRGFPGLPPGLRADGRSAWIRPAWAPLRIRQAAGVNRWGNLPGPTRWHRSPGSGSATFSGKRKEVWQGGFRANSATQLRRLIVTQGDTEPASVEQAALAGPAVGPSLYDLRQPVPGERRGRPPSSGRWSTCIHSYFGAGRPRRGRGAARAPRAAKFATSRAFLDGLQRADRELARLLHVHDVHRSRRQSRSCLSLSESSLDPLSRTDEIHAGPRKRITCSSARRASRGILERTCQLMKEAGYSGDARKLAASISKTLAEVHQPLVQSQPSTCTATKCRPKRGVVFRQRLERSGLRGQVGGPTPAIDSLYELDLPPGRQASSPARPDAERR